MSFEQLGLTAELLRAIREQGYTEPTPIQNKAIPLILQGRDIMAGLKNLVGGELQGYTELLQEARQEAMDRLAEQASALGANAVLNVRFTTSSVAQGASEILSYGTAVWVE